MTEEEISVTLPKSLCEKVVKKVNTTKNFASVSECIIYVLKQYVPDIEDEEVYSKKDEKIVKKRLQDIGYM